MEHLTVRANETTEAAIFARLWESFPSPEFAQQVLKLRFSDRDTARMHELAAKNQRTALSTVESDELDNYIKIGDLLAILQSKARKYLKPVSAKIKRHG
jgi:hypothetical protein